MLLVDSGGMSGVDLTTHGFLRVDAFVKSESVVKAYDQFGVDVLNLSTTDLRYVASLIARNEFAARRDSLPLLNRMVCANLVSRSTAFQPPPFVVREVRPPGASNAVRVAFVGLTEMTADLPPIFTVTDPVAAARRAVSDARRAADVVVVLAHLKMTEALRVAREATGANVVISGFGDIGTPFTPPLKVGDTLVEFTPYETRFVGELRFFKDAQNNFTIRDRYISLDEGIPDDAAAAAVTSAAEKEKDSAYHAAQRLLVEWQRKAAAAANSNPAKGQPPSAAPTYITAQTCATCHAEQYIKWVNTKHARISDGLSQKKDEFDASCLQCHGSIRLSDDPLPKFGSLQCEQCHGPGSLHAAKPAKGYGKVADMKSLCASCHTPQTSPKFDLPAAWAKIKH